ncbi:hypothetical protein K9M79_08595 [Candidatus Woesearchaeota archaeon]|nr:hypothetical protein [Candidatus Woesearchaeota archaeon]
MSFKAFKKGMHNFTTNISIIINTILLIIVYFIGVGITFIFAKMVGKHFLDMKLSKGSYWKTLNLKKKPMVSYYRQF